MGNSRSLLFYNIFDGLSLSVEGILEELDD
jgi:hypothetical protein